MKIGLHDNEKESMKNKKFPNLALMKISSYHKSQGDTVDWWNKDETFDKVYSSKVFTFTKENEHLPIDTIRGGTGYADIPLTNVLPDEIEHCSLDYTIYPDCDFALGYLTRGCPNSCRWCVVQSKEGNIKSYRKWQEIVRTDSQKLTLLDNNILASDFGVRQLEELTQTNFKLDLNQGLDARLVDKDIAKILASLKWQRYIRFACDQISQLEHIEKVVNLLGDYGVKPYRLFVYLLVTKDIENAIERVNELKKFKNISIYAMSEKNDQLGIMPNKLQKEFSHRYMYSRMYKKKTWEEYLTAHGLIDEWLNYDMEV